MSSAITSLFRSNTSQALRLPKSSELPEFGPESWAVWFDGPEISADFMVQRLQPDVQQREEFYPSATPTNL